MKKAIIWLLVLAAVLGVAVAVIRSPEMLTNEERIAQQIATHGFRPRESYQMDSDDPGREAPYLSMTYGNSLGVTGDYWLVMVFPSERNGKAFQAQEMELALFMKGEEAPHTFTYGQEELAAALTWSGEAEPLAPWKRNELFMSRTITVGASVTQGEGKTRFEPYDMATLMLCIPWDDECEAMGMSVSGVDDAGVKREYHNYLTLPEEIKPLF